MHSTCHLSQESHDRLVITTLTDKRTACELKAEIVEMLPVMTDQT